MNRYAAFGYALDTALDLDFIRDSNDHDPLSLTVGDVSPGRDPQTLHEAQDLPGGEWLRVWTCVDGAYVEYGDLKAVLTTRAITCNQVPTQGEIERVLLPVHRLAVRADAIAWHGSAVEYAGRGYLLLGQSGAGKSSSAHALTSLGFKHLADDMAIVSAQMILPATPTSKLLVPPEDAVSVEPPTRSSRKFRVSLSHSVGQTKPTPIAGLIQLTRDGTTRRLVGAAALECALNHAFLFSDPPNTWVARRFKAVAEVVRNVGVYEFCVPKDPNGKPTHAGALAAWIKGGLC